jgi:phosphotransacetylase
VNSQPASPPRILFWELNDPRVRVAFSGNSSSFTPVMLGLGPDMNGACVMAEEVLAHYRAARPGRPLPATPIELAAAAVSVGLADGAVGGALSESSDVLRAGLRFVGADSTVCMSMLATPPASSSAFRPLILADCAVVPRPTARQLADIALAAAGAWRLISGSEPRVALLWSSTLRPGQGHETAPYPEVIELIRRSQPSVMVDGGMQADAALNPDVGEAKAPSSTVAGRANVLIFPDLVSANITYKFLQHACGYEISSITHGFRRPFFDVSRGCTTSEFLRSAELCAAEAQRGPRHQVDNGNEHDLAG